MSYDLIQQIVDRLEHEDPKVRKTAARHLARLGDPRAIPVLANVYLDEDERPDVHKVVGQTLSVYQKIKITLESDEDVQLPQPEDVKRPRISPDALGLILRILAGLMVFSWIVTGVLVVVQLVGQPDEETVTITYNDILETLEARYTAAAADTESQQVIWQTFADGGGLNCTLPAPTSINLEAQEIDPARYPLLYEANLALIENATRLTPVVNNWYVGCNTSPDANQAATNLFFISDAQNSLITARQFLDRARSEAPTPTPVPSGTPLPTATSTPTPTVTPVVLPTATPRLVPIEAYIGYIRDMRTIIDNITGAGSIGILLDAYWIDVRNNGQSFGCNQQLNAALVNYNGVTAEHGTQDPRLTQAMSSLNNAINLTRDSLANFQQGCQSGFGSVLDVGQQRIQTALNGFNQVGAILDQIEAEIR